MRFITILFALFLAWPVVAQQTPQSNAFPSTQFAWNPAMTATWSYLEGFVHFQQDWVGFEKAPRTLTAGIQYPLADYNMGLGASISRDQTGPLRQSGIAIAYAYHLHLGRRQRLALGILGRFSQYRYDGLEELANDPGDPLLGREIGQQWQFNPGMGILFLTADADEWDRSHFFAGLSLFQLVPQTLIFEEANSQANFARVWHGYGVVGYRADLKGAFIEPSLHLDYAAENVIFPRFNLHFEMPDAFWAGLAMDGSFRTFLQIGAIFGAGDSGTLRTGAMASYNLTPQGTYQGLSYGFFAGYRME